MDGPAAGRPCMSAPAVLPVRTKLMTTSSACACRMDGAWKYSPAAAVPVSTKMPEPMMAPMPSAVSDHGPRDFLRRCSGWSASEISLSIDLQQKNLFVGGTDDCGGFRGVVTSGCGLLNSAVSYQPSALSNKPASLRDGAGEGARSSTIYLAALTASPGRGPTSSLWAFSTRERSRGA